LEEKEYQFLIYNQFSKLQTNPLINIKGKYNRYYKIVIQSQTNNRSNTSFKSNAHHPSYRPVLNYTNQAPQSAQSSITSVHERTKQQNTYPNYSKNT
jgi:hypothetical protein